MLTLRRVVGWANPVLSVGLYAASIVLISRLFVSTKSLTLHSKRFFSF